MNRVNRESIRAKIFLFGAVVLIAAGCSPATRTSLQPVKVQGRAMEPSLNRGDYILISKDIERLERGDVVLYRYPHDESQSFIHRIVGLPNEEVEIREGGLYVNGKHLEEPYVIPENNIHTQDRESMKVPEGSYYVIGDNRDHSNDSRSWGALPKIYIYGKYLTRYSQGGN